MKIDREYHSEFATNILYTSKCSNYLYAYKAHGNWLFMFFDLQSTVNMNTPQCLHFWLVETSEKLRWISLWQKTRWRPKAGFEVLIDWNIRHSNIKPPSIAEVSHSIDSLDKTYNASSTIVSALRME